LKRHLVLDLITHIEILYKVYVEYKRLIFKLASLAINNLKRDLDKKELCRIAYFQEKEIGT